MGPAPAFVPRPAALSVGPTSPRRHALALIPSAKSVDTRRHTPASPPMPTLRPPCTVTLLCGVLIKPALPWSGEQAQTAYRGVVPLPFLLSAPGAQAPSRCWPPLSWHTTSSPSWTSSSPSEQWAHHCTPTPTQEPASPSAHYQLLSPRRNRSTSGLRSMAPPNIVSGRSSAPTDPRNRISGDPSCLPRTFPAGPSPPLTRIELCLPTMAPGTQLRLEFSFQGRVCKN
jgi:hypothetical protein